jgi:predicted DCC family thiol-disulfide oxidoreductase YuxK
MAANDEAAGEASSGEVGAPDGLMLFDGLCNFCSASVNLALALDRRGVVRFCPIQSAYGRLLATRHGLDPDDPTTFAFFDHGTPLFRSTGALALAARLPAPWRWARLAAVMPRSWRDAVYDWIAANRYRLFGRRGVCRLPSEAERARFVTDLDAV